VSQKKPCKINSPFNSSRSSSRSEEQEVFQPELGKGGREHAGPNCGITGVCVRLHWTTNFKNIFVSEMNMLLMYLLASIKVENRH
jgi:hypothetical protein